jgi:hypothetical protein
MVSGSGNTEHSTSLHSSASSTYSSLPWLCRMLRLLQLKCY